MNIALEKTEEYVNGQKRRSYGDAFVRGNNGKSSKTLLIERNDQLITALPSHVHLCRLIVQTSRDGGVILSSGTGRCLGNYRDEPNGRRTEDARPTQEALCPVAMSSRLLKGRSSWSSSRMELGWAVVPQPLYMGEMPP